MLTSKPEIARAKNAVGYLSDKYDSYLAESKDRDIAVFALTAKIRTVKNHMASQKPVIDCLHFDLNKFEQYNLTVDVEISFPPTLNEDLSDEVTDLAIKLKLASFVISKPSFMCPGWSNPAAPIFVILAQMSFIKDRSVSLRHAS